MLDLDPDNDGQISRPSTLGICGLNVSHIEDELFYRVRVYCLDSVIWIAVTYAITIS